MVGAGWAIPQRSFVDLAGAGEFIFLVGEWGFLLSPALSYPGGRRGRRKAAPGHSLMQRQQHALYTLSSIPMEERAGVPRVTNYFQDLTAGNVIGIRGRGTRLEMFNTNGGGNI
jgi:hypothetical protein